MRRETSTSSIGRARRPFARTPLLALAVLAATPVGGRAAPTGGPLVAGLYACQQRTTAEDKAACYDAATAAMARAQAAGELVILDHADRQAVRRQSFGFSIPALQNLLPKDADDGMLVATVKGARRDAEGRWVVTLEGDQVWRQTDAADLIAPPAIGGRAELRHAMLGSFTISIDHRPGTRVERLK